MSDPATPVVHAGRTYTKFIRRFAELMDARSYFEIGTCQGGSLAQIDCEAVAVDPAFQIDRDVMGKKPACHLFQTTSDAFFAAGHLGAIFPDGVDLAFLDGMHLFEFLLRDFINTERHCRPDSVILLHDCLPITVEMTAREQPAGLWTGDVWKIIPALKAYRPDLKLVFADSLPTGLVLCAGLDRRSTVLTDNYDRILEEFMPLALDARLDRLYATISLSDAASLLTPELVDGLRRPS